MPQVSDHLSDEHYQDLARLIQGLVGIMLPPAKRTMVEARLRKRVRVLGLPNLAAYGRKLFDEGGLDAELSDLIDCVSTNKTDFFREPTHFDFLREQAVPAALAQRSTRPVDIKIWSAACSTGAEAYTIAMVMEDLVKSGRPLRYSVLGTDISTHVLREAEAGIYPSEFVDPVPWPMRQRYVLVPHDPDNPTVRIAPELRRKVRFDRLNLMDQTYPYDRDVDVIFCRNVLIYFDKPTQKAVVERLASHLRPGGFLLLGHAESAAGSGVDGLDQMLPTVFKAAGRPDRKVAA